MRHPHVTCTRCNEEFLFGEGANTHICPGKPHLLVDVDGVVLPHGSIAWPGGTQVPRIWDEPYLGKQWHDEFFGNMSYAHVPIRIVRALHTLGPFFNLHWASLRGKQAQQVGEVLGMPELPFLDFSFDKSDPYVPSTAKRGTVEEWAKSGQPFAWIDDAAIPPEWLEEPPFEQQVHFEVTDADVGITDQNVANLLEYAHHVQVATATRS